MSFKVFPFLSSGGHFLQRSPTNLAILVKGHKWNMSAIFFLNRAICLGGDAVKGFSIYSSGDRFVQPSRNFLSILVKGHMRNICEIILKWGHLPRTRCRLKVFLF